MGRLVIAFVAFFLASPTVAQDIEVVSGDSFQLGIHVAKLWGIEGPRADQSCDADGEEYPVGVIAIDALATLLTLTPLSCEGNEIDGHGRFVVRCTSADGIDLGAYLVSEGLAWDWPEQSGGEYADEESDAQSAKIGIWQEGLSCVRPSALHAQVHVQ